MNLKHTALLGILTLLCSPLLWATSVKTVNLVEMVDGADRVFRGRCLGVEPSQNVMGYPVNEYTFAVIEGVKGVESGQTVVFRQIRPAGRRGGRLGVPGIVGMPGYQKGQEVLLFLHADSQAGLTSPVGLTQGVFQLSENTKGEVEALNAAANRNLGLNFSLATARDMGFTPSELDRIKQPGPVPIRLLATAVEKIERHQIARAKETQ